LSGEEEDFGFREFLANPDSQLDPGHLGHENVGKDNVGLKVAGCFQGVFAIKGFNRFESVHIQNGGHGFSNKALVIDDEDAELGAAAGFGRDPGMLGKGARWVVRGKEFCRQKFRRQDCGAV
jgi:hypothetical protein